MTPAQHRLLTFIIQYQEDFLGVSPSYEEMKDAMGVASKSGIHRLLTSLHEAGYIQKPKNRARRIYVVCPPDRTPKPHQRVMGMPVFQLAEYLSKELGVEEYRIRRALLELPA